MTEIDLWAKLVAQVGFPIFVAFYLLVVHNREIKALRIAVTELTEVLRQRKMEG